MARASIQNTINSKNIRVYPTAYRGSIEVGSKTYVFDPESRLSTEENTVRPYLTLARYKNSAFGKPDAGCFVISTDYEIEIDEDTGEVIPSTKAFEFIFKGYYFKIKNSTDIFNDRTVNYYARISLVERGKNDNEDVNNIFYKAKSLSPINLAGSNANKTTLDYVVEGEEEDSYLFNGLVIYADTNKDKDTDFLLIEKGLVPSRSIMKFVREDVEGGHDLPLSQFLDTGDIDFSGSLHSTQKSSDNRSVFTVDVVNSNNKSAKMFVKSNIGTETLYTTRITNNSESTCQNDTTRYMDKDLMVQSQKGLTLKSSQAKIEVSEADGIRISGSTTITEQYKFPTVADDHEPNDGFETDHILATREWLSTDISLRGNKEFILDSIGDTNFTVKNADNENLFSIEGKEKITIGKKPGSTEDPVNIRDITLNTEKITIRKAKTNTEDENTNIKISGNINLSNDLTVGKWKIQTVGDALDFSFLGE